MTGRHYNWHKRWTVDVETASAAHENGLRVRFLALPLTEEQIEACDAAGETAVGKCWTPDGREWGIVANADNLQAVADALMQKNGPHNTPKMLSRLAREAGEVWAHAKAREH